MTGCVKLAEPRTFVLYAVFVLLLFSFMSVIQSVVSVEHNLFQMFFSFFLCVCVFVCGNVKAPSPCGVKVFD